MTTDELVRQLGFGTAEELAAASIEIQSRIEQALTDTLARHNVPFNEQGMRLLQQACIDALGKYYHPPFDLVIRALKPTPEELANRTARFQIEYPDWWPHDYRFDQETPGD